MAQFDVYSFASNVVPLVVDVQADLLRELTSRVVIPLAPATKLRNEELPRLKPRITVEGKDYILMTTDIAALPVRRLGAQVTNIEAAHRDEITNALDFLFYGF